MYRAGIKRQWVIYVVLLLALALPAGAQDPQPTPTYPFEIGIFQDPAGRFTTVYPSEWQNESTPLYGHFSDDAGNAIYFLVVDGSEPRETIPEAIQLIFPGFNRPIFQIVQTPTPNGVWLQIIYRLDNGGVAVAMARVEHNQSYIIVLVTPSQATFESVAPVLGAAIIEMGIAEAVDLQGVLPAPFTQGVQGMIDDYIQESLAYFNIPGAAVAVVQGGRMVYQQTFGVRALGEDAPVTADTLFLTGTITEGMTTTMMAAQVDAGVLDWDAPVTDILPTFALHDDRTEDMRVRDMVSHSAGLRVNDMPLYVTPLDVAGLIESLADNLFAADYAEQYTPNRQLFTVGAYLAAMARGATVDMAADAYIDLMQTTLFEPAGMGRTTLDMDAALADADVALSSVYDPVTDRVVSLDTQWESVFTPVLPAYGAWSTLNDMTQFLIIQAEHGSLTGDVTVVSADALNTTHTPQVALGADTRYGLGWFVGDYYGQPLIYNGGSTLGYTSDLVILPQSGFGVVILTNAAQSENFTRAVRQHIMEVAFGLPDYATAYYRAAEESRRALVQRSRIQGEPVDPEQATAFVGTYEQDVVFRLDESGQFWVTLIVGEQPLLHVPNTNATYVLANMPFIRVRFFENRDAVMTATFFTANADAQALELERVES